MPYFVSYSCIKCWRCMCFLSFANDVTNVCKMEEITTRRRFFFWRRENEVVVMVNLSGIIEF